MTVRLLSTLEHQEVVQQVCLHRFGPYLAVVTRNNKDCTIRCTIYGIDSTGQLSRLWEVREHYSEDMFRWSSYYAGRCVFTPDKSAVVSMPVRPLALINFETGETTSFGDPTDYRPALVIAPDGTWVAYTFGKDNTFGESELESGFRIDSLTDFACRTITHRREICPPDGGQYEPLAIHPSGQLLAVSYNIGYGPGRVELFHWSSGSIIEWQSVIYEDEFKHVGGLGFDAAGHYLGVSAQSDSQASVDVIDLQRRDQMTLYEEDSPVLLYTGWFVIPDRIIFLGSAAAVVCHLSGSVSIKELASGIIREQWRAHNTSIVSIDFQPLGKFLATADRAGTVKIWLME